VSESPLHQHKFGCSSLWGYKNIFQGRKMKIHPFSPRTLIEGVSKAYRRHIEASQKNIRAIFQQMFFQERSTESRIFFANEDVLP